MQSELNVIADAIDSVQEAATADVEPTANPVPLEAYLRPDVPVTPLPQSDHGRTRAVRTVQSG